MSGRAAWRDAAATERYEVLGSLSDLAFDMEFDEHLETLSTDSDWPCLRRTSECVLHEASTEREISEARRASWSGEPHRDYARHFAPSCSQSSARAPTWHTKEGVVVRRHVNSIDTIEDPFGQSTSSTLPRAPSDPHLAQRDSANANSQDDKNALRSRGHQVLATDSFECVVEALRHFAEAN